MPRRPVGPQLERLELREVPAGFDVTNTLDSGTGSLATERGTRGAGPVTGYTSPGSDGAEHRAAGPRRR